MKTLILLKHGALDVTNLKYIEKPFWDGGWHMKLHFHGETTPLHLEYGKGNFDRHMADFDRELEVERHREHVKDEYKAIINVWSELLQ